MRQNSSRLKSQISYLMQTLDELLSEFSLRCLKMQIKASVGKFSMTNLN